MNWIPPLDIPRPFNAFASSVMLAHLAERIASTHPSEASTALEIAHILMDDIATDEDNGDTFGFVGELLEDIDTNGA